MLVKRKTIFMLFILLFFTTILSACDNNKYEGDYYTYELREIYKNGQSELIDEYIAVWNGKGGKEGDLGKIPAPKTEVNGKRVTSYHGMFYGYDKIKSLDLSNFDSTQITDMSWMFSDMENLESLNLQSLDTSSVKKMSHMFYNCNRLKKLDLTPFDTANVEDMGSMFDDCKRLVELKMDTFDTSKVTDMSSMFSNVRKITHLDVSMFDTSKVEDMSWMFQGLEFVEDLDLSNFNTSKVEDMSWMFSNCAILTTLNIRNFNTARVLDMSKMFFGDSSLENVDVSHFDLSSIEAADKLFAACYMDEIKGAKELEEKISRKELPEVYDYSKFKDQTIGAYYYTANHFNNGYNARWNGTAGKEGDLGLIEPPLKEIDGIPVNDYSYMFSGILYPVHNRLNLSEITKMDLSKFDTSEVRNMSHMFRGMKNLEDLDISSFNTSLVYDMRGMFTDGIL